MSKAQKGRGRPRAIPDEDRAAFLEEFERVGRSTLALAEHLGLSYSATRNTLNRFGVRLERGAKRDANYHPKLGIWSDSRIAREKGVSPQSVGEARRRRGIPSPIQQAIDLANKG